MRATVINTGAVDPALVAYNVYKPIIDPNIEAAMMNKFNQVYEQLRLAGSRIADTVKKVSDYFLSDETTRQARQLVQDASIVIRDDMIQCHTYDNIYDAGYLTRRYIMANPHLYDMYAKNRINGWGDEFYNPEPDVQGEWRDDYLDVVDGWIDEDRPQAIHVAHPIDSNLSDWDRMCVHQLWSLADRIVRDGNDPTDPDRGEL